MNKTDELKTVLLQDKAQWQKAEQKVSSHCPKEAARLNSLFASTEKFAQAAQNVEEKGLQLPIFLCLATLMFSLALKTGFLHLRLNKAIKKSSASPKKITQ